MTELILRAPKTQQEYGRYCSHAKHSPKEAFPHFGNFSLFARTARFERLIVARQVSVMQRKSKLSETVTGQSRWRSASLPCAGVLKNFTFFLPI